MTHRLARPTLAGLAAATLLAATAGPAAAERLIVQDPDDRPIGADIGKVKVAHTEDRIKVKVFFDDLVRDAADRSQWVSVFFDTDPDDRGPEFRLGGGLNDGTDYTLSRVESWNDDGRSLRRCDYLGRIDWSRDTVTYLVDPPCFRDVEAVAVAVRSGEATGSGGRERRDWLGARKEFTAPVARD